MRPMKKILTFSLIIFFYFSSFLITVASTEVYPRTEEDLGVSKDFFMTPWRKKAVLETPKVDADERLYDFANVLSEKEEKELEEMIVEFVEESDMDLAVVTINENPKKSAKKYADDFYDYNDFGFDFAASGIVLLIDVDTGEIWISPKGNAVIFYNDERLDLMLDKAYSYITCPDCYSVIQHFVIDCSGYYQDGIPLENQNCYIDNQGRYRKKIELIDYIAAALISSFVAAGIVVLMLKKVRTKDTIDAGRYVKGFWVLKSLSKHLDTWREAKSGKIRK